MAIINNNSIISNDVKLENLDIFPPKNKTSINLRIFSDVGDKDTTCMSEKVEYLGTQSPDHIISYSSDIEKWISENTSVDLDLLIWI